MKVKDIIFELQERIKKLNEDNRKLSKKVHELTIKNMSLMGDMKVFTEAPIEESEEDKIDEHMERITDELMDRIRDLEAKNESLRMELEEEKAKNQKKTRKPRNKNSETEENRNVVCQF